MHTLALLAVHCKDTSKYFYLDGYIFKYDGIFNIDHTHVYCSQPINDIYQITEKIETSSKNLAKIGGSEMGYGV